MAAKDMALLVDFGGVLTTSVWDSFDAFCRQHGLEQGAVKALFRDDPAAVADLRDLETGRIEEAEFERRFAERLGLDEAHDLIDSMFRGMLPEPDMVNAVRAARRAGARTGLISNSWSTDHYDRDLLAQLFDAVVISGEVGVHKPEPEIYLIACERLDVEPAACLFVDDLRENCAGAETVGMRAILHRDPQRTVAEIARLLDIEVASASSSGEAEVADAQS
jgi:putative hydrolase of the HAD superfamily